MRVDAHGKYRIVLRAPPEKRSIKANRLPSLNSPAITRDNTGYRYCNPCPEHNEQNPAVYSIRLRRSGIRHAVLNVDII